MKMSQKCIKIFISARVYESTTVLGVRRDAQVWRSSVVRTPIEFATASASVSSAASARIAFKFLAICLSVMPTALCSLRTSNQYSCPLACVCAHKQPQGAN